MGMQNLSMYIPLVPFHTLQTHLKYVASIRSQVELIKGCLQGIRLMLINHEHILVIRSSKIGSKQPGLHYCFHEMRKDSYQL